MFQTTIFTRVFFENFIPLFLRRRVGRAVVPTASIGNAAVLSNGSIGKTVELKGSWGLINMEYFAYVLQSINHRKRYYGSCQDLDARLKRHNEGKVRSTKAYQPYKIIYYEKFTSRSEAFKREMFFKTLEGYQFLKSQNIIE